MKCNPEEFRIWHEGRIMELYNAGTASKLSMDREQWMFREKWICCTHNKEEAK